MNVIRYTGLDGSKNYSAMPDSTKELFRIFSVYGIDAVPVKWMGYYDLMYRNSKENGGPKFITTGVRCLRDWTCKRWLEFADKHCPEANRLGKDILWTEMKKYVEQETLN